MCFAFRDFYVEMASLEIPVREDYKEICGKCHMNDTDKSTTDFWGEIIVDPDYQKKHSGLLLSPRLSFHQIVLCYPEYFSWSRWVSLGVQRLYLL